MRISPLVWLVLLLVAWASFACEAEKKEATETKATGPSVSGKQDPAADSAKETPKKADGPSLKSKTPTKDATAEAEPPKTSADPANLPAGIPANIDLKSLTPAQLEKLMTPYSKGKLKPGIKKELAARFAKRGVLKGKVIAPKGIQGRIQGLSLATPTATATANPGGMGYALAHIPADTPYAMVSLKPYPLEHWPFDMEAFAPFYKDLADQIMTDPMLHGMDPAAAKLFTIYLDIFGDDYSTKGLEKLGFSLEPMFAIYGVGVYPVMRMEVRDGVAIQGLLDKLKGLSDGAVGELKVGAYRLHTLPLEDWTLAYGVSGNELLMTAAPTDKLDALLPLLTGTIPPKNSLAGANPLVELYKTYRGSDETFMFGYVDMVKMVDGFAGAPGSGMAKMFDLAGVDMPMVKDDCASEYRSMAAWMPRMIMRGDSRVGAQRGEFILEIKDPSTLSAWSEMTVPVLGLSQADYGTLPVLFSMGFGVAVNPLLAWIRSSGAKLQSKPWRCDHLEDLNEAAKEMAKIDIASIPPVVKLLQGGSVAISKVNFPPDASGNFGVHALGVVKGGDAAGLWGMAKMLLGVTAPKSLPVDGSAMKITLPKDFQEVSDHAFVTSTSKYFGVALGDGQGAELEAFLKRTPAAKSTMFSVGYDYVGLLKYMTGLTADGTPGAGESEKIFKALIAAFGDRLFLQMEVQVNTRGVVFVYEMQGTAPKP